MTFQHLLKGIPREIYALGIGHIVQCGLLFRLFHIYNLVSKKGGLLDSLGHRLVLRISLFKNEYEMSAREYPMDLSNNRLESAHVCNAGYSSRIIASFKGVNQSGVHRICHAQEDQGLRRKSVA
jgi:hypothetical protein